MGSWDLIARLYQKFRNRFPFGYFLEQENRALVSLINIVPSGSTVALDLGTGSGNVLELLKSKAVKIGIDSCLSMLTNANKNVTANFINCDLMKLSIKNRSVDLLFAIGVFEYFSNLDLLFQEIERVLKVDSYLIVSYSPNNIWSFLRQFLGHRIYPLDFEQIKTKITQHGFIYIKHNKLTMQHQLLLKRLNNGPSSL